MALAFALALACAGCGDPALWARWRAERAFWHAQRNVERVLVRQRVATPADYARAEESFRAIVAEFPSSRWSRPQGTTRERDVAEIAGRSSLALARLAELQGRGEEAAEGYARVEREWGGIRELSLEAAVLRATAFERLGREEAALAGWEHVLRDFGGFEPMSGEPRRAHLQALRRLEAGLAGLARPKARDSLLAAEGERFAAALAAAPTGRAAGPIADALAECRLLRGDLGGALDALRAVLGPDSPLGEAERARRLIAIGEHSLAAGRADSARAYARWAAALHPASAALPALQLEAQAEEAAGRRDSALAVYARIVGEHPREESVAAEARFQRGRLLQALGRWTLARTEFSALCAAYPSHPRSLEAWERVVRHHRDDGELELARIEAGHALGAIDQLSAMQHDPAERARVAEGRAAVLLAAGRIEEGVRELQGVWAGAGMSANGARLGELAAREAEAAAGDRALARRLWQILARSAPDPELRARAAAALEARPS